jgi:hypothetical protein
MNEGAYYLQVYIDKYHMKKERLNRGSYTVASSVANLIYKPLVLEPGVLILVGSFQQRYPLKRVIFLLLERYYIRQRLEGRVTGLQRFGTTLAVSINVI